MIVPFSVAILNRAARRRADKKAADLAKAYDLPNGPAWLLARMTETAGELSRIDASWMLLRTLFTVRRSGRDLDHLADQVRAAIGPDAMETTATGWRLSPLGRFRTRRALGEDLVF